MILKLFEEHSAYDWFGSWLIDGVLGCLSHVALSQGFVDGQQTGDLLDDDFPGQFDWTVAIVRPLALRLEPAGFLMDGQRDGWEEEEEEEEEEEGGREGGREGEQVQRRQSTTWLKVAWWPITDGNGSHWDTDWRRRGPIVQLWLWIYGGPESSTQRNTNNTTMWEASE